MNDTPNDKPQGKDDSAEDLDVTRPLPGDDEPTQPLASEDKPTRPVGADDIDVTRDLNEAQSDFISQPSDAIFGAQGAGPPQQVGDVLQIGPYAIVGSPAPTPPGGKPRKYIDGGEGRVYLAQHIGNKQTVVLKTPLPQHASDPVRCARLIREAEQLKNMKHRAIVKIHEINPDSDPPYYTMQHLSGGALSSQMKKGVPHPKDKVLKLAIPLADAVRYVNDELGISHRDIKPNNVMLDDKGNPYFIDFGLSRDNTGDEKSITDHRTPNTNRFKVGTARYMAPELFDGKAGNAQTDIYAFGIMLYELATGGRPYEASDYQAINKMKRLVDPKMPTQVYPEIDKGLAAVIEHAVARRAKDRYATMEDLLEDLELLEAGSAPLHATPLSTPGAPTAPTQAAPPKSETPKKKSRAGLLVTSVVLLAAIGGGIGIAMSQGDGSEQAQKDTQDGRDNEKGDVKPKGEKQSDDEKKVDDNPAIFLPEFEALSAMPGTIAGPFQFNTQGDPAFQGADGLVIWNDAAQKGFMRLAGLPVNEPSKQQYQAWLSESIDPQSARSGGTFNVSRESEVIIPIKPEAGTIQPVAFAITVEKPGGADLSNSTRQLIARIEREVKRSVTAPVDPPVEPPVEPEPQPIPIAAKYMDLYKSIELDFAVSDPAGRDQKIAEKIMLMGKAQPPDNPDPGIKVSYGKWLHNAAKNGMPRTLAAMIKNASAFGGSPGVLDSEGYTWLQNAVRSPATEAFAASFAKWFEDNKINELHPGVLDKAAVGTKRPLALAEFFSKDHWVKAIEAAKKP